MFINTSVYSENKKQEANKKPITESSLLHMQSPAHAALSKNEMHKMNVTDQRKCSSVV